MKTFSIRNRQDCMQVVRLLKTKRQLTLQSQFNQFPNQVRMSFIKTPTTQHVDFSGIIPGLLDQLSLWPNITMGYRTAVVAYFISP